MFFVLAFLFITEWFGFIVLVLFFGALGFAEMARAGRSFDGDALPGSELSSARMSRWHIAAAVLVVGNVLLGLYGVACSVTGSDVCWVPLSPTTQDWSFFLSEVLLWLLFLPVLFGPMYAVRLHRHGTRAAELIGLGLVLLPVNFLTVTSLFDAEIDAGAQLVFGIAGLVLFALGLVLPLRWAKYVVLSTSCVAILISLSEFVGPVNPVWLLTAIAMGYTVFRAEWKHIAAQPLATVRVFASPPSAQDSVDTPSRLTRRALETQTASFIIINIACVAALWLVWRIGFSAEASAPAAVFAIVVLVTGGIGAALTILFPIVISRPRSDIDHAAATFVVVLVAAAVLHLVTAPPVYVDSYFNMEEGWKPVLVTFACIGALGITVTTLTGRERQIRPFMLGIILPAAFLLPSDSIFTYLRDDSFLAWSQRLIETGIIVVILAIMWYVFGPGRRCKLERSEEAAQSSQVSEPGVSRAV